ncbi:hypothetical protein M422DRAFT_271902 [Sphaerobolus stellatus SS14]|uniref:Mnd1 HTH domain-containing protein n=1 Tax=Sphaerobolus stellatus (strain SS14) TaxID=990650 RepID=A0A0C9UNU8_SPHS4|nr:hypothetical protein M422DRAFT_271902 [Sphaerobolus stellatus SS14]
MDFAPLPTFEVYIDETLVSSRRRIIKLKSTKSRYNKVKDTNSETSENKENIPPYPTTGSSSSNKKKKSSNHQGQGPTSARTPFAAKHIKKAGTRSKGTVSQDPAFRMVREMLEAEERAANQIARDLTQSPLADASAAYIPEGAFCNYTFAGRGLSAEEKRVKLLEIFHETKDFYQLKELEKLGPKMKGIVSQSVKEVLQSLVDDGLVQSDKVGSSNFFWSFPSQKGAMIKNRLNAAQKQQESLDSNISEIKNLIEQEKVMRRETPERAEKLVTLARMKSEISQLQKELSEYGACDPVQVEAKRRAVMLAHEAAVRWTDNFSILRADFLRRTGVDWANLQVYLGIRDLDEYESIE